MSSVSPMPSVLAETPFRKGASRVVIAASACRHMGLCVGVM